MRMSQRSILAVTVAALVVGSIAAAPQRKAPARTGQKKIENTAPALRLEAFEAAPGHESELALQGR